jgi:Ras association (RalGDS/AF-6) domain
MFEYQTLTSDIRSSSTTEFQTLKREIRVLRKRLHDDRASLITTDSLDSDSSGGDYGYALRKFLLGTENVIAGVDSGAIDAEVDAGTTTLTSQSTMVDDRPFGLPESAAQFDSALAQFEFPFQEKSAEEEVRSSPVTTSRAALHTDIIPKDSRVQWTTIAPAGYAPSLEIFKTFRVGLEDPCFKVLPAALRKFNIDADCRGYALYIVCGDQEICVALDEKPLAMFKDLDRAGKDPRFMLRRLHDSVNKLEHPAPQEPTSAFMASYDAVEFHHPFQTSILARRPHLSLTTTTTEAPDDMERAHSVTPSLENRKDSRQSSGTEIDTSSPLSSLTSPHQELLESEAPIQAEREVDNGQISNQPPPQRHGCHPGSQDGHITPEESPSIIAIEQLLPRPHKCSKGENCPKWRKQQRKMRILHEEFQAAPNQPTDPVRFDPSPPSVIASSDLLGPSQLPQFAITPEALSCIEIRDPQANVVQFLGLQHLIEMPHLPDDDPRFKKWI